MNFSEDMERLFRGPLCVMGVGNAIRRDDGLGVYVVGALEKRCAPAPVHFISAGDVPENYTFRVADMDCENVLIIDAVNGGLEPGSVVFGGIEDHGAMNDYSTHRLSLGLAAKVWRNAGKGCYLLGVQAEDTGFGEGLTERVRRSADMVVNVICTIINSIPEGVKV